MKIGIIGLGKVGSALAIVLAKHYEVKGVDYNYKQIKKLQQNTKTFEPHQNEYLSWCIQ